MTRIVVWDVVVGFKLNKNKLISNYCSSDAQHKTSREKKELFSRQSNDIVINFFSESFYLSFQSNGNSVNMNINESSINYKPPQGTMILWEWRGVFQQVASTRRWFQPKTTTQQGFWWLDISTRTRNRILVRTMPCNYGKDLDKRNEKHSLSSSHPDTVVGCVGYFFVKI